MRGSRLRNPRSTGDTSECPGCFAGLWDPLGLQLALDRKHQGVEISIRHPCSGGGISSPQCPNLKVNQPLVSQSSFLKPPITGLICNCFPVQTHGQLSSLWKKMFPSMHFCETSGVILQSNKSSHASRAWTQLHRAHQIISKPCSLFSVFTAWSSSDPINPVIVRPSASLGLQNHGLVYVGREL